MAKNKSYSHLRSVKTLSFAKVTSERMGARALNLASIHLQADQTRGTAGSNEIACIPFICVGVRFVHTHTHAGIGTFAIASNYQQNYRHSQRCTVKHELD